ncbi:hypothetical protein BIT18_3613, partial [Mycobacterium tuberculosis variant bovis]
NEHVFYDPNVAKAVAAVWGVTAATAPPRPTAWTPANTGH